MPSARDLELALHQTASVIIPTINEEAAVTAAIEAAWAAGADQVIVADGGSRDATVELARAAGAQVVVTVAGRARQQNAGAALATGDVLVFQHADCQLTSGSLELLRNPPSDVEQPTHGGFEQHIDASGLAFRWLERGNAARVRWTGLAYGDQAIFVRRETFQRIGGFPNVELMEDVSLMRRLRHLGPARLLPGPLRVSARRWQKHGVLLQTLRNWTLLTAYFCGVSPATLHKLYRRHDQ